MLHRWMHALLSGEIRVQMQYQKGNWIVLLLFQNRNNFELHVLLSNTTLCKYKIEFLMINLMFVVISVYYNSSCSLLLEKQIHCFL